jgi:hypothetical protein
MNPEAERSVHWLIKTSLSLVSHLGKEMPRVKVLWGGERQMAPQAIRV